MGESPCCVHVVTPSEKTDGIHLSVILQEGLKEGKATRSKDQTIIINHKKYII